MRHSLRQRAHWDYFNAVHQRRLTGIGLWNEHALKTFVSCDRGHRQNAIRVSEPAIQRQFAEKHAQRRGVRKLSGTHQER